MRKGAARTDWTAGEVRRLRRLAGTVPAAEVARRLKRSRRSVACMASRLGLSLAYVDTGETFCPSCGSMRFNVGPDGICGICRERAEADRAQARIADGMAALKPADRAAFERMGQTAGTRTRSDAMPARPNPSAYGNRRAWLAAHAAWRRECESTEEANLHRLVLSQTRRAQRIERRLRGYVDSVNGLINETQPRPGKTSGKEGKRMKCREEGGRNG